MSIQFAPDVQARFDAWTKANPQAVLQAFKDHPAPTGPWAPALTAAIQAGVITPTDIANAPINTDQYAFDPDQGAVASHEGIPGWAKAALGGIAAFTGGAALAPLFGGAGAAAGASTGGAGAGAGFTSQSLVSSLLPSVIGAGTNLAGTLIQSNANKDAQNIQNQYADKALAAAQEQQTYNRGQFGSYLSRLQPYANVGPQALARLGDTLSRPGAVNPSVGNGPLVTLMAPDGKTTRQVPASQAQAFIAQGATRV